VLFIFGNVEYQRSLGVFFAIHYELPKSAKESVHRQSIRKFSTSQIGRSIRLAQRQAHEQLAVFDRCHRIQGLFACSFYCHRSLEPHQTFLLSIGIAPEKRRRENLIVQDQANC
jgi:hypothetical protein